MDAECVIKTHSAAKQYQYGLEAGRILKRIHSIPALSLIHISERNRISRENYVVHAGNILEDTALQEHFAQKKFDVVLANIVADVIIPLAQIAPQFMHRDSVFITSGIIMSRIDEVKVALEKRFVIQSIHEKKDWAAIVCTPKQELLK